ncbi:hypothetical protein [Brevundimonas sp. 'scallop']|uniref:hypothetical protein n=1 Tax=Brevundimonas sp. 'scallop' TaxID=2562582 RepID=UPI0013E1B2E4|nr:hypothetical protein [Brevundimonas sp. 'scallop']QIF82871.1 hypothetical protein E4341_14905 [Brevundimonas sp. 'scallop']
MIAALAVVLAMMMSGGADTATDRYAAGQVWEYRTRPQEPKSLLMIREVEDVAPIGRVYHVSILGIRPAAKGAPTQIDHSPVSRQTLDANVIRLSSETPAAPDYQPGIADWRAARGGVFTISVAEIVDLIDRQLSGSGY